MFFNHFRSCRNVLKCWSSVFIRQTGLSDRLLMADFAKYFPWKELVRPARLERATSWFVARRSIQLS